MEGHSVKLHVYDLSGGLAAAMSQQLVGKQIDGIWHTGIVVYGSEWYWGGILQQETPGHTGYGTPVRVIDLGVTHIPREVFEDWISEISHLYTFDTYNLMTNNCNNFSNQACSFLTGNSIPSYISDLPSEFLNTPFGRMISPMIDNWTNQMKQQSMINRGMDPSQFPQTQAALSQQVFGHQTRPQPTTTSSTTTSTSTKPVSEPSKASATTSSPISLHKEFKLLLADQKPSSFSVVFKQLNLCSNQPEIIQELESCFSKPNIHEVVVSESTLEAFLIHLENCPVSAAFSPLFILRLLVLSKQVNKYISSYKNGESILNILCRFIHEATPATPKAMSLLLAANMFCHPHGEQLFVNGPKILELVSPELYSNVDQLRTPAAGLFYNYALSLAKRAKSGSQDHHDWFWQSVTLITDLLVEFLKDFHARSNKNNALSAQEEEYLWRILSAFWFLIDAESGAKDIAKQLEAPQSLKELQNIAQQHTRIVSLIQEIIDYLLNH